MLQRSFDIKVEVDVFQIDVNEQGDEISREWKSRALVARTRCDDLELARSTCRAFQFLYGEGYWVTSHCFEH